MDTHSTLVGYLRVSLIANPTKNPAATRRGFQVSVAGLEPATNGLKGHCSTIELHAPMRSGFYHALAGKSTRKLDDSPAHWYDRSLRPTPKSWVTGAMGKTNHF